jgi:hypothetical protein
MGRTSPQKTNIETIADYITKKGNENIKIHTIPKTNLWLVAERKKENLIKMYVCNPTKTTRRLVSDNITKKEYEKVWVELLKLNIANKISLAQKTYQKALEHFYKNNNIKNTYEHGVLKNISRSKKGSTRHPTNKTNSQHPN